MTFTEVIDGLRCYAEHLNQVKAAVGQATMVQQTGQLKTFFDQRIWPVITDIQLPKGQSQWHSATTEIHRHMRLLTVEVSFVQAAQQSHTQQQRLGQIEQRIEQLQGFTQVLIELADSALSP